MVGTAGDGEDAATARLPASELHLVSSCAPIDVPGDGETASTGDRPTSMAESANDTKDPRRNTWEPAAIPRYRARIAHDHIVGVE
jgi:hypothetical protein